jgi:prevent-host-death family protein
MTSVGVRELRQRASELLRLVEGGETVEITDRGRPVALLTPLPTGSQSRGWRGVTMTPRALRRLQDLRRQLFDDVTDMPATEAVTAA